MCVRVRARLCVNRRVCAYMRRPLGVFSCILRETFNTMFSKVKWISTHLFPHILLFHFCRIFHSVALFSCFCAPALLRLIMFYIFKDILFSCSLSCGSGLKQEAAGIIEEAFLLQFILPRFIYFYMKGLNFYHHRSAEEYRIWIYIYVHIYLYI